MASSDHSVESPGTLKTVPWFRELKGKDWKALFAAWLGYLLDGFDFVLMGLVLTEVAQEFDLDPVLAASLISAAFISRWFGGMMFGAIADRWGRKSSMILSIITFSVGSVVCAIAPGYWVMFIARLFIGLGMAGEYSASSLYVIESWPQRLRNRASGFLISGFAFGAVVAAQAYALIVPNFGWRWLFAAGLVPIAIALWLRRAIPEAHDWKQMKAQTSERERRADVITALFADPKRRMMNIALAVVAFAGLILIFTGQVSGVVLAAIGIVIAAVFVAFMVQFAKGRWPVAVVLMVTVFCAFLYSWPIQALLPTYAKTELGYEADQVAAVMSFAGLGAGFGNILAGFTGDWLGTRRAYWMSLVVSQLLIFPVFLVGGSSLALFGFLILAQQIFGQGISGLLPKWIGGYFAPEQRAAGLGFTYNVGALGGAVAPVLGAALASTMPLGTALAVISFTLTGVVIVLIGFNVPYLVQRWLRRDDVWPTDNGELLPQAGGQAPVSVVAQGDGAPLEGNSERKGE